MQKHILIVDDQPGIRLLLSDFLEREGYLVTTASTGQEAIDRLSERPYHLLIIDYKLPILDGMEVLERKAKCKIDTPTIIMSGLVENLINKVSKFPQVKELIAKPFNILEIGEHVKKHIRD